MSNLTNWGSTYLSPTIKSVESLVYRTKTLLGYPAVQDELTDAQWLEIVRESLEVFTQFGGGMKDEWLMFTSDEYEHGCGINLSNLITFGCSDLHCYQTTVVEQVTSIDSYCNDYGTYTGYLSATPYYIPEQFDVDIPSSIPFTGTSGQDVFIYFDPEQPWNANKICNANCVYVKPVSSQSFQLSSSEAVWNSTLNFASEELSSIYPSISSEISAYSIESIPVSSLGDNLSAIPVEAYNIEYFYPEDEIITPPLKACVNVRNGTGRIYPNCDASKVNTCCALSAQYSISDNYNHVITNLVLSSTDLVLSGEDSPCLLTEGGEPILTEEGSGITINYPVSALEAILEYFEQFCSDCSCNCHALTSVDLSNQCSPVYTFTAAQSVISGEDGEIYPLSATDISPATHVRIKNLPSCTINGSIPLTENDGILTTFTLCNTALDTNGPMTMNDVQFIIDHTLPEENVGQSCGWKNTGFALSKHISSLEECVRHTPEKIKIDLTFKECGEITNVGTVTSVLSGNYDESLGLRRKVHGLFTFDEANGGVFGGSNSEVLFNFDYALMGNMFGYDLRGNRSVGQPNGFNLVTYHLAKSFIELAGRMLRYVTYSFDPKTQYLKIHPEPNTHRNSSECCNRSTMGSRGKQAYVIGVKVEAPINELMSEYFIREYVLARAMQVIGNIRSTYQQVTLYSGQTLNGDQMYTQGTARIETLLKELRNDFYYSEPTRIFFG